MTDRVNDTSAELTEVRTVLSRAKTALARLEHWQRRPRTMALYVPETQAWEAHGIPADPDMADMMEALTGTVMLLERWQGKRKSPSERYRDLVKQGKARW